MPPIAAEARYADLYDFAPVGYCTLDSDGVIRAINLTGAATLEAERAWLVGRPLGEAITPVDPRQLQDHLVRCRRATGRVRVEIAGTLASGRFVELSLTSVADARDPGGWRMNTVFTEATETHREILDAKRAKDELLEVVSHELRTPLGALIMWSQVLRTSDDDPIRRARALDAIEQSARRQVRLVDDLIDVARSLTGQLSLSLSRVAFTPLVEHAVAALRPAIAAREIDVRMSLDPAAGDVRGDPARLTKVVSNLLEHALRFSAPRGVVTVTLARASDQLRLTVRDDGAAIPADELPRLFDPFAPHGASPARAVGSMGLGLAVTRALVVRHDGTITVTSGDRGAAFTVTLPALAASARDAAAIS